MKPAPRAASAPHATRGARAVKWFRAQFAEGGSPARAASEKAYMKSALRFHGVDAAQMRAAAKTYCAAPPALDRESLRAVVDALYATDWFDLRSVAIALLERKHALLTLEDAAWLAELARAGACWAHVDFVVTKVVGPLLERHPRALAKLVRGWAKDESFWVRRVALLAQLAPLRRGEGDFALFTKIAAPMLEEREFFIRKAIGWVLREVSKKRPALVHAFLEAHGARASGLTRREAMKYLPGEIED